jgi:hypothetical protein
LLDPDHPTKRQATPDVLGVRQHIRGWLERIEETRRLLNAAAGASVDHGNVTSILDVYGKAKAVSQ